MEYLVTMFFVEMTLECQEELKKYFSSISQDIVSKIEDFHRYEVLGLDEPAEFMVKKTLIYRRQILHMELKKESSSLERI